MNDIKTTPKLSSIVYATPFRENDKQSTGISTDSGFKTIDEVAYAMGAGYIDRTKRLIIYGSGNNHVAFSDFPFYLG